MPKKGVIKIKKKSKAPAKKVFARRRARQQPTKILKKENAFKLSAVFLSCAFFVFMIITVIIFSNHFANAWSEPQGIPPSNDKPTLLNTSSANQYKEGWLCIGTSTNPYYEMDIGCLNNNLQSFKTRGGAIFNTGTERYGLIVQNGKVGIGTTTPQEKLVLEGGNFLQTASNPKLLSYIAEPNNYLDDVRDVYVSGKYAYAASISSKALVIIDVSNPASPQRVGFISDPNSLDGARSVNVSGKYAYVTSVFSNKLVIIDISNPANPQKISEISDANYLMYPKNVYVSGKYAYITSQTSGALAIVDISNPASPQIAGQISGAGNYLDGARDVYVSGKYAYVTSLNNSGALVVIDISNPASPQIAGQISGAGNYLDGAYGIYVSGKYAYIASEDSDALVIIDISNPASPQKIGQIAGSGNLLDGAKNVFVSGKYAYATSELSNSLVVVDISNPASPQISGQISGAGNYLSAARGVYVSGKYVYVASLGSDALAIFDVSGIDSPAANIGNTASNNISVTENTDVANNLYVRSGINIGGGGVMSDNYISALNLIASSTIKLTPSSYGATAACNANTNGTFYFSINQGKLCYCNASGWKTVDSGHTACN